MHMPTYDVHWTCEASQTVTVTADSLDEAIEQSEQELSLFSNISNDFDMGDAEVYAVDCDGERVQG